MEEARASSSADECTLSNVSADNLHYDGNTSPTTTYTTDNDSSEKENVALGPTRTNFSIEVMKNVYQSLIALYVELGRTVPLIHN